jgi:dienelactone hydrolase
MAPVDQYDSYARALAGEGFLVAAHEWYSSLTSDIELA